MNIKECSFAFEEFMEHLVGCAEIQAGKCAADFDRLETGYNNLLDDVKEANECLSLEKPVSKD